MTAIAAYTSGTFPNNSFTSHPYGVNSMGMPLGNAIYQLSSAQLLTLQTTAVSLVAAPGANLMLVPFGMTLKYKYGTVAYTIGNADNAFRIEYAGQTTALVTANATGLANQTADTVVSVLAAAAGNIAQANAANLGLEVKLAGTTPALTLGNGTVTVNLRYTIVPVP